MPFGRVGLSGPERALPGRYRVRPSRKREGEGKNATPKRVSQGQRESCVNAFWSFALGVGRTKDACRNSANASIVSQKITLSTTFLLRPKFRQLQRLLGPAYLGGA